jgi:glycosyltransferase involved in cell wall biosynthesis
MQFGLIPIMTRETGHEPPADCAIVLDRASAAAIADAVARLLASPAAERLAMRRRVAAWARAVFSRDRFARRAEEVLALSSRRAKDGA